MGGAVSSGENNDALIDNLIEADYIKDSEVERIFRAVDRAFYYVDEFKQAAYKDLAWKHGNLHLSAPCIYSQVMESLELKKGLSFLNLGSGTGYLCTMVGLVLGANGVNHGVEIHADVVEYARKRLLQFIKISSAMDEYEFCIPQFIQGNCLSLASNSRRYHRIYCGAACPESYELYMKQLLEIDGILVMPMNDQLLQIRRLSEFSWTVTNVLPVSFATLLLPESNIEDAVVLPPLNPSSLQELCRFSIRAMLKERIESEHPDLWQRNRKHPKQKRRSPMVRSCVVPIYEESDDSSDTESLPDMDADADVQEEEESSSDESDHAIDLNEPPVERRVATVRRPDDSHHDDEGNVKTKREKFDSGVSDLCESSNERSPCSNGDQPSATSTSTLEESTASTSASSSAKYSETPGDQSSTMDVDASDLLPQAEGSRANCDCDGEPNGRQSGCRALSSIRLFAHSVPGEQDRAAIVIFEGRNASRTLRTRYGLHKDLDEDSDSSSGEELDSSRVIPEENFSYYMKQKIKELPLPFLVQRFLNFDRRL